jgi:hypothetical protein
MAEANQARKHATPAASAASAGHADSPRHEQALRRCEIQVDRLTAVLASGRPTPGTETFDSAEGSADCDGGEQACSSEMFVTTVVGVTNSHLRGEPEPTGKAHGDTACRDVRDKVLQVRISTPHAYRSAHTYPVASAGPAQPTPTWRRRLALGVSSAAFGLVRRAADTPSVFAAKQAGEQLNCTADGAVIDPGAWVQIHVMKLEGAPEGRKGEIEGPTGRWAEHPTAAAQCTKCTQADGA